MKGNGKGKHTLKKKKKKKERSGIAHLILKVESWKFSTHCFSTLEAAHNCLKGFFAVLQTMLNSSAALHRQK